jgi:hypothetical protein
MIYITLDYSNIFYVNLKCCFSTFEDLATDKKIIKLSPNYTNNIYKHLLDKIPENVKVFCIVKNPFHRFVSFYKDKFIESFKNKNTDQWCQKNVYKYFSKEKIKNFNFNLSELINTIQLGYWDEHICLQSKILEQDVFNHKINILKVEDKLFNQKCEEIFGFQLKIKNKTDSYEYISKLTLNDKLFLYDLYEKDFHTFNYVLDLDDINFIIHEYNQKSKFLKSFQLGMMYINKNGYKHHNIHDIFSFLDKMFVCAYYVGEYKKAHEFITYIISSEQNIEEGKESEISKKINRLGKNLQYVLEKLNLQLDSDKVDNINNVLTNKITKFHTIGVGIPCIPQDFDKLDDLLKSIVNQTLVPDYVIISLSSASKQEQKMFQTVIAKYNLNFHIFMTTDKQNASQNRNLIIDWFRQTNSIDVLSFIDSDDEMHHQRLEIILKSFNRYSCDLLLHGYYRYDQPPIPLWFRVRNSLETSNLIKNTGTIICRSDCRLHYGHLSISKNVKTKFQEHLNIGEDYQFTYDSFLNKTKIHHIQIPLTKYLERNNNENISFCFTLHNRMLIKNNVYILKLFPKCLKTLLNCKKYHEKWEICVSDFQSNDIININEEINKIVSIYNNVTVKYIKINDKFNRGLGLNKSFKMSTYDIIFFLDVDMLFLDRNVIDEALSSVSNDLVYFPMCSSFRNMHHINYFCQNYGYGNVCISRNNFLTKKNGWLEKYSWGKEDNDMYDFFKNKSNRNYIESFCHQWHPNPTGVAECQRMIGEKTKNNIRNYICIKPCGTFFQKLRFVNNYYSLAISQYKKLIVLEDTNFELIFYNLFSKVYDLHFVNHDDIIIDYKGINLHKNYIDWTLFKLNKYNKYNNCISLCLMTYSFEKYLDLEQVYKKFDTFIDRNESLSILLYTNDQQIIQRFKNKYEQNRKIILLNHKNISENIYACIYSDKFIGKDLCHASSIITDLRKINNKVYIIKPSGGLCNYLRVIFSYYKKCQKNNQKLHVLWNITDECNGYFLDYFKYIEDISFEKNTQNIYNIDYTGCVIDKNFEPEYDKLQILPFLLEKITKLQHTLNNDYISIHIRRTDHIFLAKKRNKFMQLNEFYKFIELFPNKSIYVATDNLETYKTIQNKFPKRVILKYHQNNPNLLRQTSLEDAIIDLYMCIGSSEFMGTTWSSFSDLIIKLRK